MQNAIYVKAAFFYVLEINFVLFLKIYRRRVGLSFNNSLVVKELHSIHYGLKLKFQNVCFSINVTIIFSPLFYLCD